MIAELPLELVPMARPAIRPNTIFHVGVSGGKDSTAALLFMLHESGYGPERIKASFCDTGNEHEWTYAHVERIGLTVHPVETIKPDLGFFELAHKKKRFPSSQRRFCTQHLKIYPSQKHIERMRFYGLDVIAVSGVRSDESEDRRDLPEWGWSATLGCPQWRPLIRWTIDDVMAIHARHGVPLNPLYALGAQRVGCWPCIMSRKSEIRTIALKFPERIAQIREVEEAFERDYGRYSSFFSRNAVPERFRSKAHTTPEGETMMVPTINDVVRWALTGDRAQGAWDTNPEKAGTSCQSGFCE